MQRIGGLVAFVFLVALVAWFGGQFRPGEWYVGLQKPTWTPPGWVFPVVWTALYLMMAVAGWLVWRSAPPSPSSRARALAIWAIGLALNAAWSWIFFGRHMIGLGLVDIVLLWVMIAAFIVAAWRVSTAASLLFVPYLAWVTLASALNFAIWRANG